MDKVGVRLNVVMNYRITNPEKLVEKGGWRGFAALYTRAQLILREHVGRYRLDELLSQKEELSGIILEKMKANEEEYCVEIVNAGIKDIILPVKSGYYEHRPGSGEKGPGQRHHAPGGGGIHKEPSEHGEADGGKQDPHAP